MSRLEVLLIDLRVLRNSIGWMAGIGVTERWRRGLIWRQCGNMVRLWRYNLLWWGSGLWCCDVGCYGMVVLIRVVLVVYMIMVGYSDGTLEHEGWFEGGRQSVYKERLIGVGGFPFLFSLLVLLYSKASVTSKPLWVLFCLDFLNANFEAICPDYENTFFLRISPTSNPARYTRTSPI